MSPRSPQKGGSSLVSFGDGARKRRAASQAGCKKALRLLRGEREGRAAGEVDGGDARLVQQRKNRCGGASSRIDPKRGARNQEGASRPNHQAHPLRALGSQHLDDKGLAYIGSRLIKEKQTNVLPPTVSHCALATQHRGGGKGGDKT